MNIMDGRKNIVVTYSPFAMEQTIYCWVDGDCTEQRRCNIEEIPVTVNGLKRKYQVRKIELVGPQDYVEKFKTEMLNSTYDFSDCSIEIINR